MEAKRLPKYRTKNEEEYINGDDSIHKISGGIQRYKNSIHGQSSLKYNGMIAYVENQSVTEWLALINNNLQQKYPNDTMLVPNGEMNEFMSQHLYANSTLGTFTMHHFWINFV